MDEFKKKQQLYKSEEDLVDDFQRLVMLNDSDGITMRITKLYKHQDTILIKAQQIINKLKGVEQDNQVKNVLIQEQSEALNHNYEELKRYLQDIDIGYRQVETEIL